MVQAPLAQRLGLGPYVVATPALRARMAPEPLGFRLDEARWFDPMRRASAAFLDCLEQLDEATFGPVGMRMPRWAFYDCAELPGAILGLGCEPGRLPSPVQSLLGASLGATDFAPLTMCMATPMASDGDWLVYSISSLLEPTGAPDAVQSSVETLALTLEALRVGRATGTTQWTPPRLEVHARFAPLDVRACWVPAHTHAATCVYQLAVASSVSQRAIVGLPEPSADAFRVDGDDEPSLRALQHRLEGGGSLQISGISADGHALARWSEP